MDERKQLIVGIDPGSTVGFAVFDISGKLIEKGAVKELGLDQLIKKIITFGRVLVVGCDKAKVPDFVAGFATKLGAKVICPDEDLLVDEKRKLAESVAYNNNHELDAVASALFAFRNVSQLFKKIDVVLEKDKKQELSAEIKSRVLKNNVNIKSAVSSIESENKKVQTPVFDLPQIVKKEKKVVPKINDVQKQRLVRLSREKQELISKLSKSSKIVRVLEKRIKKLEDKHALDERIAQKEKRIIALSRELEQRSTKIQELRLQNSKIIGLLAKSKDHVIMPRLKTLGWQEFSHRIERFPVDDNSIIFVDDPFSFSQQTIDVIRQKNITVLSPKKFERNPLDVVGIAILNVADVSVEIHPTLAVIKTSDLEKKRKERFWVQDIVQEYKNERNDVLNK
ncbi:DUF460 domain-containing protein [Candidatus Woesearchaeota archaeon]|nr:DUF460 domain-containing protein [Candidatus Woesearchaeota archaeon]